MPDIANDPRLDPRLKAALAMLPSPTEDSDVVSRDASSPKPTRLKQRPPPNSCA